MVADGGLAQRLRDPGAGAGGVGHGLLGGEGFRGDDEQGAGRVERGERVGDVGAVHIGDEMRAQLRR